MQPRISWELAFRGLTAGHIVLVLASVAASYFSIASIFALSEELGDRPKLVPHSLQPQERHTVATTPAAGGIAETAGGLPADTLPEDVENTPGCEPEEWRGEGDYTLRVQKTKTLLPGGPEQGGPREVELLTYNGALVGPTIRVRRGTTLRIKVINELPATGEPPVSVDAGQEERPHDLYTTNLHTHGLHVSPGGDSDNVFREIPPGGSFQYRFEIPPDHPTGTFWYHPHKHGSLAYQMAGGMAGALIVEGALSEKPAGIANLDDIPEIASAKERILILQQLLLRTDASGVGRVDPNDVYNNPSPDVQCVTAINGVVLPTYTMCPQEVQRWRLIGAGREGSAMLCWYNDQGMRVGTMPFYEIAVDGLATGRLTARFSVTLHPGKRSDVLIKAPAQAGVYYFTALQEDESCADGSERLIVNHLARLVVQGKERPMKLPAAAELAACKPFESIAPADCQVKRNLLFYYDDKQKMFHINGLSFSKQTGIDRHALGSAEEWTLTAASPPEGSADEPHPFHIHVNPFQVVQIETLDTGAVTPLDEWRDTVLVERGKKLTIRVRFRDFAGKTVLHCHTLDHEDQGMMKTIQIVDPKGLENSDDAPLKLTLCRLPAPPLTLPTSDGAAWDLFAARERIVILVFFRGMKCVHCMQELRNLLDEARDLAGPDTLLVAVSSAPISDPQAAVKSLPVPPGLDFHLLVDERQAAFRSFECYDDGPLHGLFVIDKQGVIRARYAGDLPFADAHAVGAFVRQLVAADRQALGSLDFPWTPPRFLLKTFSNVGIGNNDLE